MIQGFGSNIHCFNSENGSVSFCSAIEAILANVLKTELRIIERLALKILSSY